MSHIGQNIKKIRVLKKMSQADFASLFNLARPSVGAYEEGRAEPKIDTTIQIAKRFGLSIDLLLTKELTVNDLFQINSFNEKLDKVHRKGEKQVESSESSPIKYVRIDFQIEYLVNNRNKSFLDTLPHLQIPGVGKGEFMAFQNKGTEMEFSQQGIHHGDILIGEFITRPDRDKVVIAVTRNAVLCRRLIKLDKDFYQLKADNPDYPDIELSKKDVQEIWQVRFVISDQLNAPKNIEEKVLLMERKLEDIIKKLDH